MLFNIQFLKELYLELYGTIDERAWAPAKCIRSVAPSLLPVCRVLKCDYLLKLF